MTKTELKQQRVAEVNAVIKAISNHGRRFFYYGGSKRRQPDGSLKFEPADRIGYIELRRGMVYFVDEYTQKAVYTHNTAIQSGWNGFNHGGTLRRLVEDFRDYIMTGQQVHPYFIGLPREDGSFIWGYTKMEIDAVKEEIAGSPVFRTLQEQPA